MDFSETCICQTKACVSRYGFRRRSRTAAMSGLPAVNVIAIGER